MRRPDSPTPKHSVVAKVPLDGSASPTPGKVSEMFQDFLEPLLDIEPGCPPQSVAEMQSLVDLAMLCWNLPVFQAHGDPKWKLYQSHFDHALETMPVPVQRALRNRVHARRTEFREIPFLIEASIRGDNLSDARLVAAARLPRVRPNAH